jgi:tetratricopeptide (TPR) repeat protein
VIVTFYSYKGGVGRSMAMANVADILARRGARVLMIDFDLEAPGLEQYFQIHQPSARRHAGLLDLLLEFKHAMSVGSGEAASADFRDVRRFILPVYERLPGDGCLDLMPAGEREDPAQLEHYAFNVRSFDWQDFYFNWEGELFFEWLRGQLVPERYDLVLVDSRTGVTEMGGICAYQLGDVIVMMCAANHQNVRGTQNVAADFLSPQVLALRQSRPPQIVVVPARIEQRRQELLDEFMARFAATFGDSVPEALRARGIGFADLLVPYEPQYAFDERILADPANVAQRERIATAFHRLADAMTYLAAPGTRLAALAQDAGDTPPQVAAQYDLTARYASYDAYIVTATADCATAEAFAEALKRADLRAFVDELDAVPPPEWQRRSEQQLFHSRALVVFIGPGGLTPAQSEGLQHVVAAVRASRNFVTVKVLLPSASPAPTPGLGEEILDLREGVSANKLDPLVARIAALAPARPEPAVEGAPPESADQEHTLTWTTRGTAVAVSSPFRPLERFQEHDAAFFFGRNELRARLLDHLRSRARVWVLGPSGSGKRSLVMAGAFSELRRSYAPDSPRRLERIVPGTDPVASLTRVLARLAPGAGADARHVLFIDELEKVFAPSFDARLRTRFLERVAALERKRPDIVTVIAVRSDFVRALAGTPLPVPADDAGVVRVGDLTRDELRQAIEKPTARAGLTFEPGLVDRIIEDLGTEAFRLPLLQLLLQSLYVRRREGFLTNAAYDDMGGVRGLLIARADAALDGLNDAERALARRVLPRLVNVGPHPAADRIRRALRSEFESKAAPGEAVATLLEQLTASRLVVLCTAESEAPAAELVHPVLAQQWPRLREWVEADREFLRWRELLSAYRADWEKSKRDPGGLLSGAQLEAAKAWRDSRGADLNAQELEFIGLGQMRGSMAARTRRWAAVALAIVCSLALALGWWWWMAEQQLARARAERAILLVAEADAFAAERNYPKAMERYTKAIPDYHESDLDRVYAKRGQAYAELADPGYDSAIADLTTAIKLRPGRVENYLLRGALRATTVDWAGAKEDFDVAIDLRPADPAMYYRRAVVHDAQGKNDAALADYEKAIELRPDDVEADVEAYLKRGSLLQRMGRVDAAIADYRKVAALTMRLDTRTLAERRLAQLGDKTAPADVRVTRVFLHYVDGSDAQLVDQVAKALAQIPGLAVKGSEEVPGRRTSGNVRYFFPQDERAAAQVRDRVERALSQGGYTLRLSLLLLDATRSKKEKPGDLEVWIPPLRATSLLQEAIQSKR